jgi:hypothetical protein
MSAPFVMFGLLDCVNHYRYCPPLLRPDPDVPLSLGAALRTVYERAHYERRINYNVPPVPPLSKADADWVASVFGA